MARLSLTGPLPVYTMVALLLHNILLVKPFNLMNLIIQKDLASPNSLLSIYFQHRQETLLRPRAIAPTRLPRLPLVLHTI